MLALDSAKLKTLLGQSFTYQGVRCQVIEVLSGNPSATLVLRAGLEPKVIQPNQYGDAAGWAPQTFTTPILDQSGERLNPDLPELARFDLLA